VCPYFTSRFDILAQFRAGRLTMKHVTFEGIIRTMNNDSAETERKYRERAIARDNASVDDLPRIPANAQKGEVTDAAIEYLLFRVLRNSKR
jgi:hypothetical protein